jgi:hypothetical protein
MEIIVGHGVTVGPGRAADVPGNTVGRVAGMAEHDEAAFVSGVCLDTLQALRDYLFGDPAAPSEL